MSKRKTSKTARKKTAEPKSIGGARPGAGRKLAYGQETITTSVRLPRTVRQFLESGRCEGDNITQSIIGLVEGHPSYASFTRASKRRKRSR